MKQDEVAVKSKDLLKNQFETKMEMSIFKQFKLYMLRYCPTFFEELDASEKRSLTISPAETVTISFSPLERMILLFSIAETVTFSLSHLREMSFSTAHL